MPDASDLPDLTTPFATDEVPDGGMLHGLVDEEEVVVVRRDGELVAVAATCTHYGAPLAEGLFDGRCIRCPWHHAAFDVGSGRADRGPAITGLARHVVVVDGATAVVRPVEDQVEEPVEEAPQDGAAGPDLGRVVIVGGGPAGHALAHRLRLRGARAEIRVISGEGTGPVDRPNLSKDYLAGEADAAWMPLPGMGIYDDDAILQTDAEVTGIDLDDRRLTVAGAAPVPFDVLVVATGAGPRRLPQDDGTVRYLRTQADADAIADEVDDGDRAVVVGGSFIGLEAASALVDRGVEVDLVTPDEVLLEGLLGPAVGERIARAHREAGVRLHTGRKVDAVADGTVTLDDGTTLQADVVVAGIGVEPRTDLLAAVGAQVDDGVVVDDRYRVLTPDGTPLEGVHAIGDVARRPLAGGTARIEHFAMAVRDGQVLGDLLTGTTGAEYGTPFFWTAQHDVSIRYVGHATDPDRVEVVGDLDADDALARIWEGGRVVAVATIGRDAQALQAEVLLEADDQDGLAALG